MNKGKQPVVKGCSNTGQRYIFVTQLQQLELGVCYRSETCKQLSCVKVHSAKESTRPSLSHKARRERQCVLHTNSLNYGLV